METEAQDISRISHEQRVAVALRMAIRHLAELVAENVEMRALVPLRMNAATSLALTSGIDSLREMTESEVLEQHQFLVDEFAHLRRLTDQNTRFHRNKLMQQAAPALALNEAISMICGLTGVTDLASRQTLAATLLRGGMQEAQVLDTDELAAVIDEQIDLGARRPTEGYRDE